MCDNVDLAPLQGIDQRYVRVTEDAKYGQLRALFAQGAAAQTMVFCSTRERADELSRRMAQDGVESEALHGDVAGAQRKAVMQRFRGGQLRVLVCTELLARGVDVQQVGLVVLYDMCQDADTYLHCIGRCGRFGRRGRAVALCNEYDLPMLRSVAQVYGATITEGAA